MSSRTDAHRGWTFAVGVTLLVAAGLRALRLDSGLWYDEIVTLVLSARLPLATIVTAFPGVNQHPLYSVLAHAAMTVFGESAWSLRLPAAIFGVASVAATWALGRQLLTRAEAWAAALLLATSYHHIWFSQDARGYTLLAFLTLTSTQVLRTALRTSSARALAAWALLCVLGVYTHLTMAFVVAGQAGAAAVWAAWFAPGGRDTRTLRGVVIATTGAGAMSALVYAPFVPGLLATLRAPEPHQAAQVATASWAAGEAVRLLFDGAGAPATLGGALLAVIGGAALLRRRPLDTALLAVPAVVTVAGLVLLRQPLRPRFLFFMAGAAAICVGRGCGVVATLLTRTDCAEDEAPVRRWTAAVVGVALLLVAVSVPALPRNYRVPKQDFAAALAFADAEARTGARIVAVPPACLPLERYYQRQWTCLAHDADWQALDHSQPVLVVSTLRDYVGDGAIAAHLRDDCQTVRTFEGTLGGGDIIVCRVAGTAGAAP
jgi:4-amino-4-deoxy-L-arabinose transferase-like glycosyltransferase